jgi:hypothetical protein
LEGEHLSLQVASSNGHLERPSRALNVHLLIGESAKVDPCMIYRILNALELYLMDNEFRWYFLALMGILLVSNYQAMRKLQNS